MSTVGPTAGKPTIGDVARRAGVSKATVSQTYSGLRPVAAETRQRILDAAAELHWTPSLQARALATSRSGAIGLVLARRPEVLSTDAFFFRFIAGCETVLTEASMGLMLNLVPSDAAEEAVYERYGAGQVDGVLLVDVEREDRRVDLVGRLDLPAVMLTAQPPREIEGTGLSSVHSDDAAVVADLVDLLARAGHTRIAHVAGPLHLAHAAVRRDAFQAAMAERGLAGDLVAEADFSAGGGKAATARLLAHSERPTAITYANDVMAYAGLSYATSVGLRVPDDLSIAGFDDDELSEHLSPPLTTVATGAEARGAAMAHLMLDRLDGRPAEHRMLDCMHVVPRGSVAQPPRT